jgi:DNA-binding transcriptional ArsR family regulator
MLADLHDQVSVHNDGISINKSISSEEKLSETAMMLVPSVFVWPNIIIAAVPTGSATLTYPARGVGRLWTRDETMSEPDDALAALVGRSRAAILACLQLPHSTSELSLKLGQSAPAVSQHLSVLRRSGLVVSWRSGRSVLYRCTALATSIIEANDVAAPARRGA